MANYRLQVRLPWTTGLPEDVTVNTFHCVADGDAEAATFAASLVTFYQAIDANMSSLLSAAANACQIRIYDLADAEPRVPVSTTTFTLTPGSQQAPQELAVVMSFQGAAVSGTSQARRRGRVFLGPWSSPIVDFGTGRVHSTILGTLVTAAQALIDTSQASAVYDWTVWSPTSNEMTIVTNGWMDNEWDIMRSRGRPASVRSTFA